MEESDTARDAPKAPRLLQQLRDAINRLHYSQRTEETYVHWVKRFIYFSGKRHPAELGAAEAHSIARSSDAATHRLLDAALAAADWNRVSLGAALYSWITMLLPASSPARAPGGTTQVASYSSTISGPVLAFDKSERRTTGVSIHSPK